MSGTEALEQIKEAAFVDELQKSEDGVKIGVAMGLLKEAEGAREIPAAQIKASPPGAKARAQSVFKERFGNAGAPKPKPAAATASAPAAPASAG